MQTLELIARRIRTTEDLRSIVRTMKSLAAVSIRQYEVATSAIAEYHQTVELGLQVVLSQRPIAAPPRFPRTPHVPKVIIVFGTDHGLCGRFNEQIVDFALDRLDRANTSRQEHLWLIVGARAQAQLEARGMKPDASYFLPGTVSGLNDIARSILVDLDRWQSAHGATDAIIFFNRREEFGLAKPHMTHLLPVDPRYLRALAYQPWKSRRLPTFTMKADKLFASLIRQHLFVTLFRAGAESCAAEHSARLMAMQAAERNIADKLEEMTADYRQERQSTITAEILDIIAGYEAVARKLDTHD